MMRKMTAKESVLVSVVLLLSACAERPGPELPSLKLDPQRVGVVGFSSGAIMAQQLHLAYSDHLAGAVLLSGPPYQCAEGDLDLALSRCLKAGATLPDSKELSNRIVQRAAGGDLAPLSGLIGDRVLVMHGKQDTLVPEAAARASLAVYESLIGGDQMSLRWDGEGAAAHVWPTLTAGGDCETTAAPYLGKCARDFAAETFTTLYGEPAQPAAEQGRGELLSFDQARFNPDGEDASLDESGYLYRPPQCGTDQPCGLLLGFHGCEQNTASVGEAFVRDSGLNRWADVHSVVVLYPQTRATYLPLNPKACWDWWGYSGPDYDTRKGVQLRAIANMAAALGAPLIDQ